MTCCPNSLASSPSVNSISRLSLWLQSHRSGTKTRSLTPNSVTFPWHFLKASLCRFEITASHPTGSWTHTVMPPQHLSATCQCLLVSQHQLHSSSSASQFPLMTTRPLHLSFIWCNTSSQLVLRSLTNSFTDFPGFLLILFSRFLVSSSFYVYWMFIPSKESIFWACGNAFPCMLRPAVLQQHPHPEPALSNI